MCKRGDDRNCSADENPLAIKLFERRRPTVASLTDSSSSTTAISGLIGIAAPRRGFYIDASLSGYETNVGAATPFRYRPKGYRPCARALPAIWPSSFASHDCDA